MDDESLPYPSDLDIRKVETTEPALLGRRRTLQSLSHFEKVFIVITFVTLTVSLGFTIFRLSTLPSSSADFTMAVLLLLNIGFCYFYTLHGVLYEQPYEILVLVVTTIVLLIYLVLIYSEATSSDTLRAVRLVFMCIATPIVAVSAIRLAIEYYTSGNLVFRTVGADPTMQSMCRKLQRAIVLIMFDAQALASCLMLILFGTILSGAKIACLVVGLIFTITWSAIGFIGMHKERPLLIWLFLVISPVQPSYVLWQIVTTGLYQADELIAISVYVSGVMLLLIHTYLFINTVQVFRNFGKGLRERVFEVKCSTPRQRISYGSTDSSGSLYAP